MSCSIQEWALAVVARRAINALQLVWEIRILYVCCLEVVVVLRSNRKKDTGQRSRINAFVSLKERRYSSRTALSLGVSIVLKHIGNRKDREKDEVYKRVQNQQHIIGGIYIDRYCLANNGTIGLY